LWTILEGFGVPDVWLLKNIYENSSMRVQVGGEDTAAIQLGTGTVQGSVLSPLLFDLFINALLRLLDSTGISHKVRNALDWKNNSQCQSSKGEGPHSKEQRADCGMRGGRSLRPR